MTPHLGQHDLVDGRRAVWWLSLVEWAYLVITVAVIVILGSGLLFGADALVDTWVALVLVVIATALSVLVRIRGLPNESREIAAGYTTLPRSHRELDQVEPAHGRVIRPAGEPYLPRIGLPWRLVAALVVGVVGVVVGMLITNAASSRVDIAAPSILILSFLGVIIPIVVVAIVVLRFISRRNIRAALDEFPDAVMFHAHRTQDFLRCLRAVEPTFRAREVGVGFPAHFIVAIDEVGFHLVAASWRPSETIAWDRVADIRLGWGFEDGGVQYAALELLVTGDGEEHLPLRLPVSATNELTVQLTVDAVRQISDSLR